jgi:hypothetical protein
MALDPQLSALVVLRPAGGEVASEDITAENVDRLRPDPAVADAAQAYFRDAGFDVGPLVAQSFAVSAPQSLFESVFAAPLVVEQEGMATTARTEADLLELPLERLPHEVATAVRAVAFTPPPDFGPTGAGP